MSFVEKIEQYIIKHNLINQNDSIIIGLSGGPDSVFLLHMLVALQKKYNLTLIAAHLNHEWRTQADDEEKMCKILATQLNIPFVSAKLSSLISHKKYNGSQEEFARHMRRQFLEKVAHEYNAQRIALGHHAQDQQETFFIRLIRGSSLSGLIGMQPKSGLYIRPLLETHKSDILTWLAENNISYATDLSNESPDYLRNRIRLNVLPALQQCDDRWNDNFLATLKRLDRDNNFLEQLAARTLQEITCTAQASKAIFYDLNCARPEPVEGFPRALEDILQQVQDERGNKSGQLNDIPYTYDAYALDAKLFATTPAPLQQRIIMQWLIKNNVPFPATQAFLDEIIRFISNPSGGTHAIHSDWSLVKKQRKVFIKR